jgi:hypothetical protein
MQREASSTCLNLSPYQNQFTDQESQRRKGLNSLAYFHMKIPTFPSPKRRNAYVPFHTIGNGIPFLHAGLRPGSARLNPEQLG